MRPDLASLCVVLARQLAEPSPPPVHTVVRDALTVARGLLCFINLYYTSWKYKHNPLYCNFFRCRKMSTFWSLRSRNVSREVPCCDSRIQAPPESASRWPPLSRNESNVPVKSYELPNPPIINFPGCLFIIWPIYLWSLKSAINYRYSSENDLFKLRAFPTQICLHIEKIRRCRYRSTYLSAVTLFVFHISRR